MEKAHLKRRDIGIVGGVLLVGQALSSFQSTQTVNDKLQRELYEMKVRQEEYFVRKTEMVQFGEKMDRMNLELSSIKEQISQLKLAIKESDLTLEDVLECDPIVTTAYERR